MADAGEFLRANRQTVTRLGGVVFPVVVAAVLVPFRNNFAATASALLLTAVITTVAISGDRTSGYLATISATLSFDVFLTQMVYAIMLRSGANRPPPKPT